MCVQDWGKDMGGVGDLRRGGDMANGGVAKCGDVGALMS